MNGLNKAIDIAGGVNALARAINVRQSVVSNWRARKNVPAEYCPSIEKATGVQCEELRPDVDWQFIRNTHLSAGTPVSPANSSDSP